MLFWKCVSSSRRRRSSSSWPCSVILNWKKKENKVTNIQTCLKWQEWQQLIQAHTSVVHLNHSQHWNSRCYCAVGWNDWGWYVDGSTWGRNPFVLACLFFLKVMGIFPDPSEWVTHQGESAFSAIPVHSARMCRKQSTHTSSNQSLSNWAILLRLWVRPCYCEQVGDLFVHGWKGGAETKQETRAFALITGLTQQIPCYIYANAISIVAAR